MVILSTGLALASPSLFVVWVCIELNIIVFLPLLIRKNLLFRADTAIKYFVSQSIASALLVFSLVTIYNQEILVGLILLTLLFKIGLAPFHRWLIRVFNISNIPTLFFFRTIQKIIPLSLMSNFAWNYSLVFLFFLINLSFILCVFKNIVSVRLALFISTLRNRIWAVSGTFYLNSWISFIIVYSSANLFLFRFFYLYNIRKSSQIPFLPPLEKLRVSILFLRLGGIPPFWGFIQKVVILKEILIIGLVSVRFILLVLSIVTLYTYLSITLNSFILGPNQLTNSPLYRTSIRRRISVVSLSFLFFLF